MTPEDLQQLLTAVRNGHLTVEAGLNRLATLPFERAGEALVDHHRALRQGVPEIVFGEGKTLTQLQEIVGTLLANGSNAILTRIGEHLAAALQKDFPVGEYDPVGRIFSVIQQPATEPHGGLVLVASAGTSDLPVAREAATVARLLGNPVEELPDVGVAGLHRLLAHLELLRRAAVIIAIAGMEGALPSVIGGLVAAPVIAVPTSVGYGTAMGGLTALFAMLNTCASGVTVVNIDNGFGAAFAATRINRRAQK